MKEEQPNVLWFNGSIVPWEEATVHVWSELAIRGASVFDGLRAFWSEERQTYALFALDEHLERLFQSARLLRFPPYGSVDELKRAIAELLQTLDYRAHTYIRPTLFIQEGRYGFSADDTVMGAYIVAFPVGHPAAMQRGIRCCVSSWRRSSELSFSPRIKAGANYLGLRLPKVEALERGYDDVILLNDRDTVAEGSGAALFLIRNGRAYTPPVNAGILESITREKVMALLRESGIETIERDIVRTELYTADELFMCGTLCEIQPVVEVDGYVLGDGQPGPVSCAVRDRYLAIVDQHDRVPTGWLTEIPASAEGGKS